LEIVDILDFLSEEEIDEWNQEARQGKAAGLLPFDFDEPDEEIKNNDF